MVQNLIMNPSRFADMASPELYSSSILVLYSNHLIQDEESASDNACEDSLPADSAIARALASAIAANSMLAQNVTTVRLV